MQLIGTILVACLALAALRVLFAILAVAFAIALLISMCVRPKETLAYILFAAICAFAQSHPLAAVGTVVICATAFLLRNRAAAAMPPTCSDNS